MFTSLTSLFTTSRKGHLALTVAAAAIALTATPAAHAADATGTVDQAFTITAMKASGGAQARVLGVNPAGTVTLQRPTGAASQAWAPAAVGAPAARSYEECLQLMSCPFTPLVAPSPRLLVNVATGRCLTVLPGRVAAITCNDGAADERQRIHWNFEDQEIAETGVPRRYTALAVESMGRLRCLTSPVVASSTQGTKGATCTNRLRWEQQYRFTPVA
jgi:hypothetical protein